MEGEEGEKKKRQTWHSQNTQRCTNPTKVAANRKMPPEHLLAENCAPKPAMSTIVSGRGTERLTSPAIFRRRAPGFELGPRCLPASEVSGKN